MHILRNEINYTVSDGVKFFKVISTNDKRFNVTKKLSVIKTPSNKIPTL